MIAADAIAPPDARAAPGDRLRIFVPHASDALTDHEPHGDGLVAFEVLTRLAARGHAVHVATPHSDILGSLPPSLHVHDVPMHGGPSTRARLAYMLAMRRLFDRLHRVERFDLAHQLNPVFAGISLGLAGTGVPVVLGAYVGAWPADADSRAIMGAVRLPFAARLRDGVAWLQQSQAAAIIATTPAADGLLVDRAAVNHKLDYIPHGVDVERFSPGAAQRATGAPPAILFLGGTERRKGIFTLLDAFGLVREAIPGVRLVIGGAGGRLHDVRARVEAVGESRDVTLLGNVGRDAVPELIREATVFCAPSNGEPFGMSLLEAMACAKPVVVTDAGGPRFLVDDAGGVRVPVGDVSALAAGLVRVLASPDSARAMGEHNRRVVERAYAWDRVIDRIEATHRSALRRANRRTGVPHPRHA